MITTLKKLIDKLIPWFESIIPDARVKENDSSGRTWFLKAIAYDKELILSDLKMYTDRSELNKEYSSRFYVEEVKGRKGLSAIKIEISSLYSFNKCFVQRYKGRLHFYRDDLSQKGKRNLSTVGQAMGILKEFKKNLD